MYVVIQVVVLHVCGLFEWKRICAFCFYHLYLYLSLLEIQSSEDGWLFNQVGRVGIQLSGEGWNCINEVGRVGIQSSGGGSGFNQVGRVGIQSSGEGWDSINQVGRVGIPLIDITPRHVCVCLKPLFGCPI